MGPEPGFVAAVINPPNMDFSGARPSTVGLVPGTGQRGRTARAGGLPPRHLASAASDIGHARRHHGHELHIRLQWQARHVQDRGRDMRHIHHRFHSD
jgi:hypothetical protein